MKSNFGKLLCRKSFRSYIFGQSHGKLQEFMYRMWDLSRSLEVKSQRSVKFVINSIISLRSVKISNTKLDTLFLNQLPWDPPIVIKSSPYRIFLLVGPRDLLIFPLSLATVKTQLSYSSKFVTIVCPSSIKEKVSEKIDAFRIENIEIDILTDEELMSHFELHNDSFPSSHVFMQIAKFLLTIYSNTPKALILDGDTLFLRKRCWDSEQFELLVIPPEFEITHAKFSAEILDLRKLSAMGYTTQSQIMSKDLILEMCDRLGGIEGLVRAFSEAYVNFTSGENKAQFPCEWQLYGDWLRLDSNAKIHFIAYKNVSISRDVLQKRGLFEATISTINEFIIEIQQLYPEIGSLSFHHYK